MAPGGVADHAVHHGHPVRLTEGVEVGQIHQLPGHVVDDLAALGQIVQDHVQLVIRQVPVRLVDDQQGTVVGDAAVCQQIDPLQRDVEPGEPLAHADGDGGLVVAGGLIDGPGGAGEDPVDGGGQQALPVEVRLPIGAVVVIGHHVEPNDVVDVKGLLPAGGLAGDHDGVSLHAVLRQHGGIHRGIGVLQGQVVAEIRVNAQEADDPGVQSLLVGEHVDLHVVLQPGQIVPGGLGDVVDAAARQVDLGPLLRNLGQQQVEHQHRHHRQSRQPGRKGAPAGGVAPCGLPQAALPIDTFHVHTPPLSSTGASG